MKYIGIDYGRKKIGIAVGEDSAKLAEPYIVLRGNSLDELLEKVIKIVEVEKVDIIIIGLSEGQMAEETREFGRILKEKVIIPVIYHDETLTSKDAQNYSLAAGIKRKKRKVNEDAYAATLMLQGYLDNLG